jgi:hypothetical protein
VTVSSNVRASLNRATTRGLAGCNVDLRRQGSDGVLMLAQQSLEREDAPAAVFPCPGGPAQPGQRPCPGVDRAHDCLVVDDPTVADDHGFS